MKEKDVFNTIPELNYSEKTEQIDAAEFEKVICSRRSVRVYTKEEIPEPITRRCLSLGLLAPNSSNLQPWEFYWVRTPEKRKELVKACLSQNSAKTAAELIVCVGRTKAYKKHSEQMIKVIGAGGKEVPEIVSNYYGKIVPYVYNQGPFGIFGFLKRIMLPFIGMSRPNTQKPKIRS